MLRIIKADQPIKVDRITVTIYSLPGIGKTSLAFTAGKVLLIDTDDGSYRSGNRGDTVRPASWSEIAKLADEDLSAYDVIALDTAGRALDMLTNHILENDPKMGRKSGDLSLQGFGALKAAFVTWVKRLRSLDKDVILLSHLDERMEGDIIKDRLDIQGGSKAEIYKCSDAIGKLYIDGKLRKLDFSPREGALGKNPAQFDIMTVPNFAKEPLYFAGVISDIKKALNRLSEGQVEADKVLQNWRTLLHACKNAADFNALLPQAVKETDAVKMLVMAEAKAKGLKFNKEEREFYGSEPPAPPAPTQTPTEPEIVVPEPITAKETASEPTPETVRGFVEVITVKNKKKRNGAEFLELEVQSGGYTLKIYYWHKSLMDTLLGAVGKTCDFELMRNVKDAGTDKETVFYSVEHVHKIGDQVYIDDKPYSGPTAQELFEQ